MTFDLSSATPAITLPRVRRETGSGPLACAGPGEQTMIGGGR
jgi:hypothetical protein